MAETRKKTTKKTVKPGKEIVGAMGEELRDKLLKIIRQDVKELALDMKSVKNIDSTGLGVLIAARNSLDQVDGQLNLKNVPENIENLLQVLGLDRYFNLNAV